MRVSGVSFGGNDKGSGGSATKKKPVMLHSFALIQWKQEWLRGSKAHQEATTREIGDADNVKVMRVKEK